MNQPPPLSRDQRKIDSEHLNLLAIFHFILAGLALLGIAFLVVHYAIMSSVFTNPAVWQGHKSSGPPPGEIFALFKWVYLAGALAFIGFSALNVISGLGIRARKWRTFSLVVAGVNCLQIPLGTALGVFTIVVLTRDSVCVLYDTPR